MERLPERTEIDDLVLARWVTADLPALHEVILANVDHLRARMAWVAAEPLAIEDRAALIERWRSEWEAGGDAVYAIWLGGRAVGGCGLHRRLGPGGLEIGYWVDHRHLGRGIATAASRALTHLAFTVADIDRVEIRHDLGNRASARVPEKLGFTRLADDTDPARDLAPADTGTDGVWQVTRDAWAHLPS